MFEAICLPQAWKVPSNITHTFTGLKASFWRVFRTNFTNHFRKIFLLTKFDFPNLQKKVSLNKLRSIDLEFCALQIVFIK